MTAPLHPRRRCGKSILLDGIDKVRPYHWIDGKRLEGEKRFIMEGYTEDRRVVVFSDILKDWKLEDYYNMISDGFTVEGKGQPAFVIPKQSAPEDCHQHELHDSAVTPLTAEDCIIFPISQFYGVLSGLHGQDAQGCPRGMVARRILLDGRGLVCLLCDLPYCLHQYLEEGLSFILDDTVLHDRQLLAAAGHDELI